MCSFAVTYSCVCQNVKSFSESEISLLVVYIYTYKEFDTGLVAVSALTVRATQQTLERYKKNACIVGLTHT